MTTVSGFTRGGKDDDAIVAEAISSTTYRHTTPTEIAHDEDEDRDIVDVVADLNQHNKRDLERFVGGAKNDDAINKIDLLDEEYEDILDVLANVDLYVCCSARHVVKRKIAESTPIFPRNDERMGKPINGPSQRNGQNNRCRIFQWRLVDVGRIKCLSYHMYSIFSGATFVSMEISRRGMCRMLPAMDSMFVDATSFNGKLSTWDVSNVEYMDSYVCVCNINQNLCSWGD
jgi:Mycoplasma protein of unknown function, DUF285